MILNHRSKRCFPTLNEKNKKLSTLHKQFINYSIFDGSSLLCQNYCNIRNLNVFATDNLRNRFLLNSAIYRTYQIWQTLPFKLKYCPSLNLFETKIINWGCDRC